MAVRDTTAEESRSEVNHDTLVTDLGQHFAPLMEKSPDGIYIWLDEVHKVCNERLAAMFGYSVKDWQAQVPFLGALWQRKTRSSSPPTTTPA